MAFSCEHLDIGHFNVGATGTRVVKEEECNSETRRQNVQYVLSREKGQIDHDGYVWIVKQTIGGWSSS